MKKPAIFLDRDGTLIDEVNYLSRIDDLRVFPFSAVAVGSLKEAGFLVIVVTNQSGIGREKYTEAAMHAIHDQIQAELSGEIDAFYFCPHLPGDGCECRKPGIGMLKSAERDHDLDLANSWMIGDKRIDIETGKNANLRTALVLTGYGTEHQALLEISSDIISDNFGDAAKAILDLRSRG